MKTRTLALLFFVFGLCMLGGDAMAYAPWSGTGGGGGSPTGAAGGDLNGSYPNPNVKSISGAATINLNSVATFSETGTGANNAAAQSVNFSAQAAGLTNGSAGNFVVVGNPGTGTGVSGGLVVTGGVSGTTQMVAMGDYAMASGASNGVDGAIWFIPNLPPTQTNFAFLGLNGSGTDINAPSGQTVFITTAGTTANGVAVTSTELFPSTNQQVSLGDSTHVFQGAFMAAGTPGSALGYQQMAAAGGTANTQRGIWQRSSFLARIANHSATGFQTYQMTAHHGAQIDCKATCRLVTAGAGCTTFWNAAPGNTVDATWRCNAVGSGYCPTVATCSTVDSTIIYPACDTTTGNASNPTTNQIMTFSATASALGVITVNWTAFNGTCTTDPVLDCVSTCELVDD